MNAIGQMDLATALQGASSVEFDLPGLSRLHRFSPEWYRERRRLHLARFPESDLATRDNLDMLVSMAEARP